MSRSGCRGLYTEERVRAMFNRMRADLHAQHYEQMTELNVLRRELADCRAALDELRAATLARQKAEAELVGLYRERELARARAAERDPTLPLH